MVWVKATSSCKSKTIKWCWIRKLKPHPLWRLSWKLLVQADLINTNIQYVCTGWKMEAELDGCAIWMISLLNFRIKMLTVRNVSVFSCLDTNWMPQWIRKFHNGVPLLLLYAVKRSWYCYFFFPVHLEKGLNSKRRIWHLFIHLCLSCDYHWDHDFNSTSVMWGQSKCSRWCSPKKGQILRQYWGNCLVFWTDCSSMYLFHSKHKNNVSSFFGTYTADFFPPVYLP